MAMDARLEIVQGDITTLEVDAIVNAANSSLLGGSGVDGAIHKAAGPQLVQECRTLNGCPTGEARITAGYRLPAYYVIHTVGPVWQGGQAGEAQLLANCYRNSLALAREYGCRQLAFPAISCGVYRYPVELAAQVAISNVVEALQHHSLPEQVLLVCFDQSTWQAYQQAWQTYKERNLL